MELKKGRILNAVVSVSYPPKGHDSGKRRYQGRKTWRKIQELDVLSGILHDRRTSYCFCIYFFLVFFAFHSALPGILALEFHFAACHSFLDLMDKMAVSVQWRLSDGQSASYSSCQSGF